MKKSLQGYLKAVFLFRADTSRNDFRIFDSAPAASRRDKTSIAKSNLGFIYENQSNLPTRNRLQKRQVPVGNPLYAPFCKTVARKFASGFLCDCIKNAVVFSYPQGWRKLKNKPQMPKKQLSASAKSGEYLGSNIPQQNHTHLARKMQKILKKSIPKSQHSRS